MFRTPPASVVDPSDKDEAAAVSVTQFRPPSGKLAAVTRKSNELVELMNSRTRDLMLLNETYQEYCVKIENLEKACEEHSKDLDDENLSRLQDWINTHKATFVGTHINFKKYIEEFTGAKPKGNYAPSVSSRQSVKSSTSSARVRLVEEKAKTIADRLFSNQLATLEKQELLNKQRLRDVEIDRKEFEQSILEAELNKLDGIATELEKTALEPEGQQNSTLNLKGNIKSFDTVKIDINHRDDVIDVNDQIHKINEVEVNKKIHTDNALHVSDQTYVGDRVQVGEGVHVGGRVRVGDRVHVNDRIYMNDRSHANVVPRVSDGSRVNVGTRISDGHSVDYTNDRNTVHQNFNSDLLKVLSIQNEISLKIANHQEKAELPKRDLKVFDGSSLIDYRYFIDNFKRTIEDKCENYSDRFYYLLQYTSYTANDLVKSCSHPDPRAAYNSAIQLLDREYGNEYRVATEYLDKLENWKEIRSEDGESLHSLSTFLATCASSMHAMGMLNQLNSPKEIMAIVLKLPYELRKQWRVHTLHLFNSQKQVEFKDLVKFVKNASDLINQPLFGDIRDNKSVHRTATGVLKKKILTTKIEDNEENTFDSNKKDQCLHCNKNNHRIANCFFFRKLKHEEKLEVIKKEQLCFGCLEKGHMTKYCKRRLQCKECNKTHPTSLHNDYFNSNREQQNEQTDSENNEETCGATKIPAKESRVSKVLCAVVPVKIRAPGQQQEVITYASLDTCSSSCFMNEKLLNDLNIKVKDSNVNISTMEHNNKSIDTKVVNNLEISGIHNTNYEILPVVYAQRNWPFSAGDTPEPEDMKENLDDIPYEFVDSTIGLIIGMNHPEMVKPLQIKDSPTHGVYASLHLFGWALNGSVGKNEKIISNRIKIEEQTDLKDMIQNMYERDYVDTNMAIKQLSIEDKKWLNIMKDSTKMIGKHYEIDLPLKSDIKLPNNKSQVFNIFSNLTRKLNSNKKFFEDYNEFMKMMLEKGFMEKIPDNEIGNEKNWYLMHHAVYHKQKKKIRVVFNCSLKNRGISLNDQLYQGPDLTNNLIGVIMRFRQDKIALISDIEKMFYQVKVTPHHRDYLRLFWYENFKLDSRPAEYRLTVHVFGATSSPSIANYALQQTVLNHPECRETVKTSVLRNFYVDDFLYSTTNEEAAADLFKEVKELVSTGAFNLTQFVSNNENLRKIFSSSSPDDNKALTADGKYKLNSALGLKWDTQLDLLKYNIKSELGPTTRRGLLSLIHGIFDPLGLVGPVLVPIKRLFQESCKLPLDWDDELPENIKTPLSEFTTDLSLMSELSFPRCCRKEPSKRIEIHYFSDGSESAYGAVAYARFINSEGIVSCSPILSKSRLTPLNNKTYKTIPRIELNAAKLSILLKQTITEELEFKIDQNYFWSDSSIVLQYLKNETNRFTRFVENRVGLILSNSNKNDWRYIPSAQNPADCLSRGVTIMKFNNLPEWKYGPSFLYKSESEWPNQNILTEDFEINSHKMEFKSTKTKCLTSINAEITPSEKFLMASSSWYKLKIRVAWLIRLKKYLQGNIIKGKLDLNEIHESELSIIKYIQGKAYEQTINLLKNNKSFPKQDKISRLNPYLDDNDVLRVGGRLEHSDLSFTSKHPILLPNKDDLVKRLIEQIHRSLGHMGRDTLIATIRRQYWIQGINTTVKQLMYSCITCRKTNARPVFPRMAPLPEDRLVGDSPPFTNTALDFFGPFEVVNGRKREKRYGVVFSCLMSRAIHLEMAHSLTTDSFINCLRRFMARRGYVKLIRSDNGTNLKSGKNELSMALKQWNTSHIDSWMKQREIDWKFQPPSASNFGGVFEREIRTVRKVLTALLNEQVIKLNDEHLNTLLCEVESILNCRPLTELSDDVNSFEALTPNHLILLHAGVTFPPGLFNKDENYMSRRWKQVQYLSDLFWKRWRRSYIPLLQMSHKWNSDQRNYKIGDLVLLTDAMLPRNQWSTGRVICTFPDKKGTVRVVKIKVAKFVKTKKDVCVTELVRPTSKIILLKTAE